MVPWNRHSRVLIVSMAILLLLSMSLPALASEPSPDGDADVALPTCCPTKTLTIRPTADVQKNIPLTIPLFHPTHWDLVDDVTPDGTATQVGSLTASWSSDIYSHSFNEGDYPDGRITKVTECIRVQSSSLSPVQWAKFLLDDGSVHEVLAPGIDKGFETYSHDFTNVRNRWTWDDIKNCQFGVSLRGAFLQGTGCTQVYLEVEYRPTGAERCVVGPYLETATPTSIKVMWETAQAGDSWVDWGDTRSLPNQTYSYEDIESSSLSILEEYEDIFPRMYPDSVIHHAQLTGLTPDTRYYYRVVTEEDVRSEICSFRTPPTEDSEKSFKFIVYGDNRTCPDSHSKIINDGMIGYLQSMMSPECEIPDELAMVWNIGDILADGPNYDGYKDEYFDPIQNLSSQVPFYVAVGNHEYTYHVEVPLTYKYKEENGEAYFAYMDLPGDEHKYSFDYSNCHFITLDTNGPASDQCSWGGGFEEQLAWLEADLEAASADPDIDFIFVFHHHPYRTELWNQFYGGCTQRVSEFIELYKEYDVNAFFCGHTHAMERGNSKEAPLYWVLSGGGGAPIEEWLGPDTASGVAFDWPEVQMAIDEHGFHVVTVAAGANPSFDIEYVSLGNLDTGEYKDNEVIDEFTFRTDNTRPDKPVCLYPSSTDSPSPGDVIFQASPFSNADVGDYHHETQWQITTVSGQYPPATEPSFVWPPILPHPTSPVVADIWVRYENIYGETPDGTPIDTQAGDDLINETITIPWWWSLFNPSRTYYWHVRYRDGHGLEWSEWSDEAAFTMALW